jgi:4-amino-4-deoxy-L-arabinose transferase-like glycosyltransferase
VAPRLQEKRLVTHSWLWVPAAALALGAIAGGVRLGGPAAGLWAAVAALGQCAVLQLIQAGPAVGYQHVALPAAAWRDQPAVAAAAVALVVVALAGVVRHRRSIARWVAGQTRPWTVVVAVAGTSLLAAAPSASPAAYLTELAWAAILQLAIAACVGIAAATLPGAAAARLGGVWRDWLAGPHGHGLDRFAWITAGLVVVAAALLCLTSYQAIPHVPDEVGYMLQARYLAEGLPWMEPPPVPAAFDTFLLEVSGDRWYSVFPPGWPMVLAVGVTLGVPWLVNPLLGGACILLTYLLVQELTHRGVARLTIVLLAVSPWFLFLSMSFMSHVLSLALALATALGTVRVLRGAALWNALAAGLALGVLGMSRPLEGVAVAALAGVPLLVHSFRQRRIAALAVAVAGTVVTGGLGLAYNRAITGSALRFPAEQYFDREYGPGRYGMGFGPEKGVGWTGLDPLPGHGAADAGINAVLNGFMINVDLLGWGAGSLLLALVGVSHARRGAERLMVVATAVVIVLHSAYWFSGGPDFGARYWFLIIVPLALLSARGLSVLIPHAHAGSGPRVALGAAWLSVMALVLFLPWRAVDKYRNYRGVRADLMTLRDEARYRDGLVLVSGARHPDWAGAAIANDITPGRAGSPVFAWDRDAGTRQAVLDAFPQRPVWLVDGPTKTGGAYRVTAGPIAPEERSALLSRPAP